MAEDVLLRLVLYLLVGTMAAIVYSLRVLVLLDRKIERIEVHIERMTGSLVRKGARSRRR